jgi:hypothetical protein
MRGPRPCETCCGISRCVSGPLVPLFAAHQRRADCKIANGSSGAPAVSQFAIGSLPLCQKPFLVDGIAMDRLPTRDIDSTCSGESSLRTARISRRTPGPSLGAREEGGQ